MRIIRPRFHNLSYGDILFTALGGLGLLALVVTMFGTAKAQANPIRVYNIPLITTLNGLDCGVTLQNSSLSAQDVVILRWEFIDAADDTRNVGFGFSQIIKPGRRYSVLLSSIIGKQRDGSVNIFVAAPSTSQFRIFALLSSDFTRAEGLFLEAKELTIQQIR